MTIQSHHLSPTRVLTHGVKEKLSAAMTAVCTGLAVAGSLAQHDAGQVGTAAGFAVMFFFATLRIILNGRA
jgi:hypothetical protein